MVDVIFFFTVKEELTDLKNKFDEEIQELKDQIQKLSTEHK